MKDNESQLSVKVLWIQIVGEKADARKRRKAERKEQRSVRRQDKSNRSKKLMEEKFPEEENRHRSELEDILQSEEQKVSR